MNTSAVPQAGARLVLVATTALVGAVLSALLLSDSASAATPVGKDGRIHACYRVKGKQKGAMRLVAGNRCRRGERRLAWAAAGTTGGGGVPGQPGTPGAPGSPEKTAVLEARVASLTLKLEGLENLLQGIGRSDLLGAIGGLARLNALCAQATALTDQANLLRGAIAGLSLNGILTGLGGLLNIPALPVTLPVFTCP